MCLGLLAAAGACSGPGEPSGSGPSPGPDPTGPADRATVTVDVATTANPARLRQGYLHGVPDTPAGAAEVDAIDALAPAVWRLSNLQNFAAYKLLVDHGFPARHGTRLQWNLNDVFSATHGFPVVVDPGCNPAAGPRCMPTFEALKSAWSGFVEDFMVAIQANGTRVDEFDFFSEPDVFWHGLSGPEQFFELFQVAHDIVRRHRPLARIVGPSVSKAPADGFAAFFEFLATRGLRLDAVAWHEFERPEAVAGHVAAVRQAIAKVYAARPELAPAEIHINEYAPPQAHLIPGWTVAWLAEFERAGVDAVARACWNLGAGWSDCDRGLNGLLLADQKTPQPLYWVHWNYARLSPSRVTATTNTQGLSTIASHDGSRSELLLLLGRQSCGRSGLWCAGADLPAPQDNLAPLDVTVQVENYGGATAVHVARTWIPGSSLPQALAAPSLLPVITLAVSNGSFQLPLPQFEDGGAYVVKVSPAR